MPDVSYEVVDQKEGQVVKRTDPDGKVWWIPMNPDNADYQAYLAWLEEQDA